MKPPKLTSISRKSTDIHAETNPTCEIHEGYCTSHKKIETKIFRDIFATCDPIQDPELEQCSMELQLGSNSRCSLSSSAPPLLLTDATCECGGQNDLLGRQVEAASGAHRDHFGGATVRRNVKLWDMNVHVDPSDECEVEVLAAGLPIRHGAQLAVDFCGHHRAACARAGVLGRRGFALESVAARICREAGGRVRTNMLVRDVDLDVPIADAQRLEWLWMVCRCRMDTTVVCALHADGRPRLGAAEHDVSP